MQTYGILLILGTWDWVLCYSYAQKPSKYTREKDEDRDKIFKADFLGLFEPLSLK